MHVDRNKILGCLVGAAAADAMGAATEVRTQQQIKDYFWRLGDDLSKTASGHVWPLQRSGDVHG
ncbi:ADP-ribosylglycohydrolase [Salmonella enterica subsp. enterica]|uniref:ADP-ribosylglycohydrolase n=1 Tax=Salmonella enterica I TaxID=59201 RepID=A0A3S4LPJ0_SALET|nr:ADP-ribosylglycohydrolase [Salmonella enterica subsp. enterica]